MTSPRPPWWRNPDDPATDPSGFPRPRATATQGGSFRRVHWGWVLAALFVLLAVLLALVLHQLRTPTPDQSSPPGSPGAAGASEPTPTLPVVVEGYRYTIGVGAFTPTVETSNGSSAPPGRHFLTATVVIRSEQQDRTSPALLNSDGDAPAIVVGLAPVAELPPVHTLSTEATKSDCTNDPRNASMFIKPIYPGLPPQTCIVGTAVAPANPVGTGESDRTMAPGATTVGVLTTIDLPDDVPTPQVSAWISTASTSIAEGNHSIYVRIPAGS